MERDELVRSLAPLAMSMRVEIDKATWGAYHRVLADVPSGLLRMAVDAMMREPLEFFPKAGELRAAAERQRRAYLAAFPYDGCSECEDQRGYRTLITAAGQKTVEPCPCKVRWRERLESYGVGAQLSQLHGESNISENEQVYPTAGQLPEAIRQQLSAIAGQKVLR